MTTFEVTTLLPHESRELREDIESALPDARFERFDATCFNVSVRDEDGGKALENILEQASEKTTTTKWRLV